MLLAKYCLHNNLKRILFNIWCLYWRFQSNCCLLKLQYLLLFIYCHSFSIIMQVCGCDPTVDWQGRRFCQWWHLVSCSSVCYKQWRPTGGQLIYCIIYWLVSSSEEVIHLLIFFYFTSPALCSSKGKTVHWQACYPWDNGQGMYLLPCTHFLV